MAAHVLQELEIEDGADSVVVEVTSSLLATATAVVACLRLAPGHGLVLVLISLLVEDLDAWMLIVHHLHHFGVAEVIARIVTIFLCPL